MIVWGIIALVGASLVGACVILYTQNRLLRRVMSMEHHHDQQPLAKQLVWQCPEDPKIPELFRSAQNRRPERPGAKNVLPKPMPDLNKLKKQIIPQETTMDRKWSRFYYPQQKKILRYQFRGKTELEMLNALCISYLRRVTPHEKYACELFHRIWREEREFMISGMDARWCTSTLLTFADFGETESQRLAGSVGFIYGNMIVGYESERAYFGTKPDAFFERKTPLKSLFGVPGYAPISLGNSDHVINLNRFVYEMAAGDATVGPILERLLQIVRVTPTFFGRWDQSRIYYDVNAEPDNDKYWAFGVRPPAEN